MLIFFCVTTILFAQTIKTDSITPEGYTLNLAYNVMSNITLGNPGRYRNKKPYRFIQNGIYLDMKDKDVFNYRMTVSYIQGTGNINYQYPIEDILDKYRLYVSHDKNKFTIELGGDLDSIIKAKNEIIGKKVFNRDYLGDDKKRYVKLVIE